MEFSRVWIVGLALSCLLTSGSEAHAMAPLEAVKQKPPLKKKWSGRVNKRASRIGRDGFNVSLKGPFPKLSDRNVRPLAARTGTSNWDKVGANLRGKVFYNDLREFGRFDWRSDITGAIGVAPAVREVGAENYLGAFDVSVDLYEIDARTDLASYCRDQELLASTTVGSDGSFSFDLLVEDLTDPCRDKDDPQPDLAVLFRLEYCTGTRCYKVVDPDGNLYQAWHGTYTPTSPLKFALGASELGSTLLQTSSTPGDLEDDFAVAASVFASLTESTRVWHEDEGVSFQFGTYGEQVTYYPADVSVAKATSAVRIKIPRPSSSWLSGDGVQHEYGHILHFRAWGDSIGACGECPEGQYKRNGNSSWSATSQEYPVTAFQEGWANFAARVAYGDSENCSQIDTNEAAAVMPAGSTTPAEGESYPGNVTKFLCDFYDDEDDADATRSGAADTATAGGLFQIYSVLTGVWTNATTEEKSAGLDLCSFVNHALDVNTAADSASRLSLVRVGGISSGEAPIESPSLLSPSMADDEITSMALNNGIQCTR